MSLPDRIPFSLAQNQVVYSVWQCLKSGYCAYPRRLNGLRVLYNLMDGTIENQCAARLKRGLEARDAVCTLKSQPPPASTGSVLGANPTVALSRNPTAAASGATTSDSVSRLATSQSSPPTTLSTAVFKSMNSQSPATTTAAPPICLNNAVVQNVPGCIQPTASLASLSCSVGSNQGAATFDPPKVRTS